MSMRFSPPERGADGWSVAVTMGGLQFKTYAWATKLAVCEAVSADLEASPDLTPKFLADALANAALYRQNARRLEFGLYNLEAVGRRLQGPWDPVRILQQPNFHPASLPDFLGISGEMGRVILAQDAFVKQAQPELFA